MLVPVDSLKKRYFAKLLANVLGTLISIAIFSIVPRSLGPKSYGDFTFLRSFFTAATGFLDLGTPFCFYTKLSQRPKDLGLISFYLQFSALFVFTITGFSWLANHTQFSEFFWPGQESQYVYMAALLVGGTWVTQVLNSMADAIGATVHAELIMVIQKIIGLCFVVVLFYSKTITLTTFFTYHYIMLGGAAISLLALFNYRGYQILNLLKFRGAKRGYISEFSKFCHPILTFKVLGCFAGIFDIWLLQVYHGSAEQGYLGLSSQISAICLVFISALSTLLTREMAIAFNKKEFDEMALMVRRYFPSMFALAAFFSCFIAVEAETVTSLIGGREFEQATATVAIMAIFPAHQIYGQLCGSFFYSTGKTALRRNIAICVILLGIPLTYFLVAPQNKMGLDGGAIGLALKMIIVQIIGVNVQLYYILRFLNQRLSDFIIYQATSLCLFFIFAFTISWMIGSLTQKSHILVALAADGVIYTFMAGGAILLLPKLFGIRKEDIDLIKTIVLQHLKPGF